MKQNQHFPCRASAYARCSSVTQLKQRHPQPCPCCAFCNYSASRQQKPRPGLEAQRVARHKPQGREDTGVARATCRLRGARRWVSCAEAGSAYGAASPFRGFSSRRSPGKLGALCPARCHISSLPAQYASHCGGDPPAPRQGGTI